jgi:hypothetical protein
VPSSSRRALRRYALVSFAIACDAGVVALLVITHRRYIALPKPSNDLEAAIHQVLPATGALVGALISCVNAFAIASLVTAYARTVIAEEGMTFAHLAHLHSIGKHPMYSDSQRPMF